MKMYEESGVNLSEANKLNNKLRNFLNISAFAETTKLVEGLNLTVCCDGIGSKIIPLYAKKLYDVIAKDIVAANLNDLVCSGAKAIGFVDYLAVNKLDSEAVFQIISGIESELKNCNCRLLGGETSEISELISDKNIDISGFAVGLLDDERRIDLKPVKEGDIVVGLCSSGVHANGFSLVRKLYSEGYLTESEFLQSLKPTYNYYNVVSGLFDKKLLKSCANITGGGILENLKRAVPQGFDLELDYEKIPNQEIMAKLKSLCQDEFFEVFNAGVGFSLIIEEKNIDSVLENCREFSPFVFGKIIRI